MGMWKGLPEVSLFIPLCEELNITVNELLNGCHIDKENYVEKAEEKLLDNVSKERIRNKKLLITEAIIVITLIIQLLVMTMVISFLEMEDYIRIIMLLIVSIPLFIVVFSLFIIVNNTSFIIFPFADDLQSRPFRYSSN